MDKSVFKFPFYVNNASMRINSAYNFNWPQNYLELKAWNYIFGPSK
jgi:hypothetical protein